MLLVFSRHLVLEMLLYRSNEQCIEATLYLIEMRKCKTSQAKYSTITLGFQKE